MKRCLLYLVLCLALVSCNKDTVFENAVDLGLSVKWNSVNAGAVSPEDSGGLYTYDEAMALSHGNWRLPTRAEYLELLEKCTWEYEGRYVFSSTYLKQVYVEGWRVTAPNGKSLFFRMSNGSSGCYRDSDCTILILETGVNQMGSVKTYGDGYFNGSPYSVRLVQDK